MLYTKLDDRFPGHAKFPAAAEAALAAESAVWAGLDVDDITLQLQGAHSALSALSSSQHTDGFLTAAMVRTVPHIKPRVLEALARPVLGRPALLHRQGEACESRHCLSGQQWPAGFTWLVHDYRQWNKGTRRYQLDVAKEAERKDTSLRLAMFVRDRGHCRYCGRAMHFATRKGDGRAQVTRTDVAQMDHVTDDAAGLDNLATGCGPCNNLKQRRTPAEAGMRLLTLAELHRQKASFRDWQPTDKRVINWMSGHPDQVAAWELQARGIIPAAPIKPATDDDLIPDVDPRPAEQPQPAPPAVQPSSDHAPAIKPPSQQNLIPDPDPATGSQDQTAQNQADHDPDAHATYPGTGQDRQPARASPDVGPLTPGLQRFLGMLAPGVPMPVWEIVQLTGFTSHQVEQGLRRLAGHQLVDRIPSTEGQPVLWQRR